MTNEQIQEALQLATIGELVETLVTRFGWQWVGKGLAPSWQASKLHAEDYQT